MPNPTDFPDKPNLTEAQLTSLGFKLRDKFKVNETLRESKELEWLEDLRMFNGVYDPEVLTKIGAIRSKAYPKVARSKTISVEARLHEITDPDIGKPWAISPSPESTISEEAMQAVIDGLVMEQATKAKLQNDEALQAGQPLPYPNFPKDLPKLDDEMVQEAFNQYAKNACKKMEIEIDDQLVDTKYTEKKKKALRSGLHLGTGIIKGPLAIYKEVKKWKPESGTYVLETKRVPRPHLEFVRVWDFYPDMTVSEIDQCEGFFERHCMTKHEVRNLAKRGDFRAEVINKYLIANPDGDCVFKSWEQELQNISSDKGEQKKGRKYEVLEYWGYADARDLQECGVVVSEDLLNEELQVNVWLLGGEVIKAVLNPTPKQEQPYHVFYFEKDDSSIFGKGLPRVMRDSQINVCAGTRMMLDNSALCAGPQVELNVDLLDPNQDLENIHQFKLWLREGRNNEATAQAVRFSNVESHIDEYLKIIKQFLDFADLETAFPTYMLIEPAKSGNETAQGASIRSGTVNITVKDVAKNFDDFNSGILEGMYAWNMDFNEDESIKGDYKVVAKGLSSLVAKEVRAMALQNSEPLIDKYKAWIPEEEFIQELCKAMDLPIKLRTKEQHDQWVKENSNPEMMQKQLDMLQAQIDEIRSKALKNTAMAKNQNVKAIKEANAPQEAPVVPSGPSPEETEAKVAEIHSKALRNLTAAQKDEAATEAIKHPPKVEEPKKETKKEGAE
jgi:hypothetical protein